MTKRLFRRISIIGGGLLGGWLAIRYVLPLLLPFGLGAGLALAAEPLVHWLSKKCRLRRWLASGIGVTLGVILLVGVLLLIIAVLVRQMGRLSTALPELLEGVSEGMGSLEQWLLSLSNIAPRSLRGVYTGAVTSFFSGSSSFLEQLAGGIFKFATGLLKALTSGIFGFATAVLSAFMISVRLPRIRHSLRTRIPRGWRQRISPAIKGMGRAVLGWINAQLKLSGIAFLVLLGGFWLLKIKSSLLWALVIAVVDALPVLGCGTVLIPWSLICLLQGQQTRGLGLLALYGLVWLLRSLLEPKLLGKELGLDPLVTLLAVYIGFRLLGLAGMLLTPMLAVAVTRLPKQWEQKEEFPR